LKIRELQAEVQKYALNYVLQRAYIKTFAGFRSIIVPYQVRPQNDPPPFWQPGTATQKHKRKLLPSPSYVDQCCELGMCLFHQKSLSKHFLILVDSQLPHVELLIPLLLSVITAVQVF
jgi:hypothetical protein